VACSGAQAAVWVTHASDVLSAEVTNSGDNPRTDTRGDRACLYPGSQGADVADGVGLGSGGTEEIAGDGVADAVASFVFTSSRSFSSSG